VLPSAAQGAVNPPEGPFKPGDRLLGNYQVLGLLGRGGHAFVYECSDSLLGQHVAIKVIPNPPERGQELTRRAREEAKVLHRLDHPNVVSVNGSGELADGMAYIVMEKLDGLTLRDVLRRLGRLSVAEALHVAAQIAEGVAAAHGQNVIHRDLKPENAFVQCGNQIKVLDFGVAKFLGYGVETTAKHLFHGTLLYMSPEHLQGFGVTFRSDVYALGTMLYEMIAGQHPCLIGVEAPTAEKLAWIQVSRVPPALDKIVRGVPDEVVRMVKRATAKQSAQRHASMRELGDAIAAALERFLAGAHFEQTVMRDLVTHSRPEPAHEPLTHAERGSTVPFSLSTEWSAEPPFSAMLSTSATAPMAQSPWLGESVRTESLAAQARGPASGSSVSPMARTATARTLPAAPEPTRLFSPSMLLGAVLVGALAAIPIGIWVGVDRPSAALANSSSQTLVPPSAELRPATAADVNAVLDAAVSLPAPAGSTLAAGAARSVVSAGPRPSSSQVDRLRERAVLLEHDLESAGHAH
jgi:serine/threonine-protein kinase